MIKIQPKNEEQFEKAIKDLDLAEQDVALATELWNKAVDSCQPKPKKVAALLGGFAGVTTQKKLFISNSVELSQSEIQMLRMFLKEYLSFLNFEFGMAKKDAKNLYERCDKDAPETKPLFDALNQVKAELRRIKKEKKDYGSIQHKLGKLLRS